MTEFKFVQDDELTRDLSSNRRGRPSAYSSDAVNALRENPNVWAQVRIGRYTAMNQEVYRINRGSIPAFGRGFEATQRAVPDSNQAILYVRYVGES